jgi:hypothetical protein
VDALAGEEPPLDVPGKEDHDRELELLSRRREPETVGIVRSCEECLFEEALVTDEYLRQ